MSLTDLSYQSYLTCFGSQNPSFLPVDPDITLSHSRMTRFVYRIATPRSYMFSLMEWEVDPIIACAKQADCSVL
jgi:hypothetical protein